MAKKTYDLPLLLSSPDIIFVCPLWVVFKWRHAILDIFWPSPPPIVMRFITKALVLSSQNHWPRPSLRPWRHLWTNLYAANRILLNHKITCWSISAHYNFWSIYVLQCYNKSLVDLFINKPFLNYLVVRLPASTTCRCRLTPRSSPTKSERRQNPLSPEYTTTNPALTWNGICRSFWFH